MTSIPILELKINANENVMVYKPMYSPSRPFGDRFTAKLHAQSLTWLGTLGGSTSMASDVSDNGMVVV